MPSILPTASSDVVFLSPKNQGMSNEWFDPEHWRENQHLLNTATGRGTVWFVDTPHGEAVLRQYRRGGLISKINSTRYLTESLEDTRPFKELALLENLQFLRLPAPRPMGGMVRRKGLFYQAWLMTHIIPNARDLFDIVKQETLSDEIWQKIGQTIRQFHDKNVFHSDLNCHNIMIDQDSAIWLIDFDKCDIRPHHPRWKKDNLDRLHRSLTKEAKKHSPFEFTETHWQALLDGYEHG